MGLLSFFQDRWAIAKREQHRRAHPLREDHFAFAHYRLRQFAQQAPDLVLNALGSQDHPKFVKDVWQLMPPGETFKAVNPELSPETINVHGLTAGPYPMKVLELPKAEAPGEAELIAIVFRILSAHTRGAATKKYDPPTFYFTAEAPELPELPPNLCQWTGDDHKVLGTLPSYTRDDFIAAVTAQVREQEQSLKSGAFFEQKL